MKTDSYWLLLLQIPAIILFLLVISWFFCVPIDPEVTHDYRFPDFLSVITGISGSCHFVDHGKVWLMPYPEIGKAKLYFFILIILFVVCQTMVLKPFLRLKKMLTKKEK